MKKQITSEKIIDHALELLKTEGDRGLTVRKVAVKAGMSHSNVQYYFKNKDELLLAVANRYFAQCLEEMKLLPTISPESDSAEEIKQFLMEFLKHGLEISEMCRIFREYWAIACRNESVYQYLQNYYEEYARIVAEHLSPVCKDKHKLHQAVSLIVPFVEGYSITANSMPEDIDAVTSLITDSVLGILEI